MSNIIFSVDYLLALLCVFKAALKIKYGSINTSDKDKVEEFCNQTLSPSDLEVGDQDIVICFTSDWKTSFDGVYEARFHIRQVPEGYILGSEESLMGGHCETSWWTDLYYLNFEGAKLAINKKIDDWLYNSEAA